ncbi:sulfurtransferase complex subunit TusB [Xenorhabdus bovienii]|uniref:Protein TusB n=1 Tax=Xenorhabdus bovienii str. Intermedium TaxID=1379677 RepID=A0A077QKD2_XENBV|nr:sulfurtransferase complex subunit TusB [Xenorhabdus bovienii]MDE9429750.1 sulfurtransferase complex subunit TusB [Xenorhabdus bovienii]MDE9437266.1 sulfurtransferase complex subunit TusB [Xenorhabdus bovienii]MDE9483443.1 sulfurtransferase complex subunit TusB [Xenorhabdus bovienii]MDE9495877.1 sulfurtransferase complex subunit TusB [Xenorhabdus bovienii]MDE9498831.1 sulfurtransferase complex subunit TusB [Xenorhabdus bovienii]
MLYTVSRSPYHDDFNAMLGLVSDADDVLLMQNGVLLGINDNRYLAELIRTGAGVYALQEDLAARGLVEQISDRVQVIDYKGFVSLTAKHPQNFGW